MNSSTDQPEKFSIESRINIASLSPQTPTTHDSHIEATVALVWPYSSSHEVLSLLLAERDVRLRKVTGQVKVTFHGHCAKEVAKTQVGIGDLVLLDLSNVSWTQAVDSVSTPGKKVSYNLEYHTALRLEVRRGTQESISVVVTARSSSPTIIPVASFDLDTPRTSRAVDVTRTRFTSSYQSPRTASHRISSGSFLDASLDPFAEDDGYIVGKGRKRTRYARRSGAWKLVDGAEEADARVASADATSPMEQSASEALQVAETDNGEHEQLTDAETSLTNGNHPPVDSPVVEAASSPEANADNVMPTPVPIGTSEVHEDVPIGLVELPALPLHTDPPVQVDETDEDIEPSDEIVQLDPSALFMPFVESSSFLAPVLDSPVIFDPIPELAVLEGLPPQLPEELQGNEVIVLQPEPTEMEEASFMNAALNAEPIAGQAISQNTFNIGKEESVAEEIDTAQVEVPVADDAEILSLSEDSNGGLDVIEEVLPVLSDRLTPNQQDSSVVEVGEAQGSSDRSPSIPTEAEENQVDLDALQSQIDDQIEDDLFSGTPDEVVEDDDMYGASASSKLREVELDEAELDEASESSGVDESDEVSISQQVEVVPFPEQPIPSTQDVHQSAPTDITVELPDVSSLEEDESQISVIPPEALEPPSSPAHLKSGSVKDDSTEGLQSQISAESIDSDMDPSEGSLRDVDSESESSEEAVAQLEPPVQPFAQHAVSVSSDDDDLVVVDDDDDDDDDARPSSEEEVTQVEQSGLLDTGIIPSVTFPEPSLPDTSVTIIDTKTDQILTPPATQQFTPAQSRIVQFHAEALQRFPLSPIPTQETVISDAPVSSMPDPDAEQTTISAEVDRLPTEEEMTAKPRRTSQRIMRRSFAGSNVGVEYFTPQHKTQVDEEVPTSPLENKVHETDGVEPSSPMQSHPATIPEQDEALSQASPQATDTSIQQSTELSLALGGTTTSLSYFPNLASLEEHYGQLVDIIAISTSASSPIQRAKSGPKDNFTTLHLTDPSLSIDNTTTLTAQIFRPRKTALPLTNKGDVILLRDMKVQSKDHKSFLLSTETSAWAVFSPRLNTFQITIAGPPVEYGYKEIAHCESLVQWWKTHEENRPGSENEREIDTSTAPQSSPVPHPTPAPISPRVTRSRMRKSATLDQEIAPININLANSTNYASNDSEVRDQLTPLLPPPSATQMQAIMSSPTTSMPGTNTSNNNRSVTAAAGARRRSTRRSESVVHELRDGTRYVDGGDGQQNLVHELRDGATYVDE